MSISTTTNRVSYNGDGSTTVFPYSFLILADTDLEVIETVASTGVETVKTLTTHYTVSGAGTGSGNVTMVTAPASGVRLTIRRVVPRTQLVDYVENDAFPAETHEQALDKLTMIVQELTQTDERSLRQPVGDSADIGYLPPKVDRASMYLGFDSDGDPIALEAPTDTSLTTAFIQTLLDDATAAAARTTLGAVASGAVTGGDLTMATSRLLGRTTASTGAIEELSVGASLTLSSGSLSGTAASTTQAGVAELATSAEVQTGTDTTRVPSVDAMRQGLIVTHSNGVVATTSGTTSDFNSIPSWVKRIIILFNAVSTSGTNNLILQLGDSGGIETSGYAGAVTYLINDTGAAGNAMNSGFTLTYGNTAAEVFQGLITLELLDPATNTWSCVGLLSASSTSRTCHFAGTKSTSAALDRLRITTVGGTDTFDAGSVVVHYQ